LIELAVSRTFHLEFLLHKAAELTSQRMSLHIGVYIKLRSVMAHDSPLGHARSPAGLHLRHRISSRPLQFQSHRCRDISMAVCVLVCVAVKVLSVCHRPFYTRRLNISTRCIIYNKIYITEACHDVFSTESECWHVGMLACWKTNTLRQCTGILSVTRAPARPSQNVIITSEHPTLKNISSSRNFRNKHFH
jgi:hypothetical protein